MKKKKIKLVNPSKGYKHCNLCGKNKEEESFKQVVLSSQLFDLCKECRDDIELATLCLMISVNDLINKHPDTYMRVSKIAVKEIEN